MGIADAWRSVGAKFTTNQYSKEFANEAEMDGTEQRGRATVRINENGQVLRHIPVGDLI